VLQQVVGVDDLIDSNYSRAGYLCRLLTLARHHVSTKGAISNNSLGTANARDESWGRYVLLGENWMLEGISLFVLWYLTMLPIH
jgi:hypothetical protein